MPTYTERMIWGMGDGTSLRAADTSARRLGGLTCWEHWMPLARLVLHVSREDIHVAAWPWVKEMNLVASRHYAFEGRCFVVACGGILRAKDLPQELEPVASLRSQPGALILRGGSTIIGPDGRVLAGPILGEETILTAEIDFSATTRESPTLDVTGHYARPDIFDVRFKPAQAAGYSLAQNSAATVRHPTVLTGNPCRGQKLQRAQELTVIKTCWSQTP